MRIKPLGDHVVLKNVEVEVTTASGLILAGAAGKEKPQFAEIVEVGPGGMIDGKEVKMEVPSARRSSIRSTPAPRSRIEKAGVHHRPPERHPRHPGGLRTGRKQISISTYRR